MLEINTSNRHVAFLKSVLFVRENKGNVPISSAPPLFRNSSSGLACCFFQIGVAVPNHWVLLVDLNTSSKCLFWLP